MRWNIIKIIYKKEIKDLLRDKKTMIMMVLVPLLLYPLIMIGAVFVMNMVMHQMEIKTYQIAVVKDEGVDYDETELIRFLQEKDADESYTLNLIQVPDIQAAVKEETLDAALEIKMTDAKLQFEITYMSTVISSSTVTDLLENKLDQYKLVQEEKLLEAANLDPESYMQPFKVKTNDVATNEENFGNILGSILPFLMVVSILLGAIYPAIDLTAGERERGTLETLLTLPLKNVELITGKFLAVSTIAVISAVLNLISMSCGGFYLMQLMMQSTDDMAGFDATGFLPALFILLLCMVAFAMFISAMVMCVTIFAKSFKEANNYLTPLMLVIMLTGYIAFIPNIELTTLTASIPIVNMCLLIKNMLVFKYSVTAIVITLFTNVIYGALMVVLLAKLYNSEEVLFREGGTSLQLFTRRKDLKPGGVPNMSDAILVLGIAALLYLYLGSLLQLRYRIVGVGLTQLIFLLVVLVAAWYTRKDFKATFSLRKPKAAQMIGAVLMEIGAFSLVIPLSVFLNKIWPEDGQAVSQSFEWLMKDAPFVLIFIVVAVLPAICEEMLFRGYLFSAAAKKLKPVAAMLLVAAFFGIYHLSIVKFFTTGLLGFIFCWVVYRSGSIYTSMLMHLINNGVGVCQMYYSTDLLHRTSVLEDPSPVVIVIFLIVAVVSLFVGNKLLGGTAMNKNE